MNIPNKLTVIRILLVPVFIVCISIDVIKYGNIIGLVIFIVASLTDALDGYIARKYNLITDFGKIMDPIADKLLVISACVSFSAQGLIHHIWIIVIVFRDLIIDSMRVISAKKGIVLAADGIGKFKTAFQMISIILILTYNAFPNLIDVKWGKGLFYGSMMLTIASAYMYIVKNIGIMNK